MVSMPNKATYEIFDAYPIDSHGVSMTLFFLFVHLRNFLFKGLMFACLNTM